MIRVQVQQLVMVTHKIAKGTYDNCKTLYDIICIVMTTIILKCQFWTLPSVCQDSVLS